jgi:hypothetical protein
MPSRGLPPDLTELETGQAFTTRRQAIQHELLQAPQRPAADTALFTSFLRGESDALTITLPDNDRRCLAVFSTPVRAIDYFHTLLATVPHVRYLCSSPLQLVGMLGDVERAGIGSLALDRCPRCLVFCAFDCKSIKTADDAITIWAIAKATHLARAELYFAYAREAARRGEFEVACGVALEAVGHVSLEDPRLHLLLGEIAVAQGDRAQLAEANIFLQFFGFEPFRRKLEQVARSGTPDFADP